MATLACTPLLENVADVYSEILKPPSQIGGHVIVYTLPRWHLGRARAWREHAGDVRVAVEFVLVLGLIGKAFPYNF
jgi:hypothetical protein